MDLDSFRCFEAAAGTLNFRAAAARVHLSPAAFSDRIRRLEDDLGVAVLTPTTRPVTPTAAGQPLLPLVRPTLAGFDPLRAAARDPEPPPPFAPSATRCPPPPGAGAAARVPAS